MKLLQIIALISVLSASIAHAGDKVVDFDATDPEMNTAIESAISTLDQFLFHFGNATDTSNYGLKVSFDIDTGDDYISEIIWVNPIMQLSDTTFTGLLANEPNWMEGKHFGDKVTFTKDMIADWYINEDGKNYGYYTIRVLVERLDESQADYIRSVTHDEVLPPYFND